jgi:mono/diheme cytochrome c family protein
MTPEWSILGQSGIWTELIINEEPSMFSRYLAMIGMLLLATPATSATTRAGNANAGRDLVARSCTTCHALSETATASDGAPPLSYIARDNKVRPAWIRGWLMDPHPPMPGIMLSRQQINDIIAYLDSLPVASRD